MVTINFYLQKANSSNVILFAHVVWQFQACVRMLAIDFFFSRYNCFHLKGVNLMVCAFIAELFLGVLRGLRKLDGGNGTRMTPMELWIL